MEEVPEIPARGASPRPDGPAMTRIVAAHPVTAFFLLAFSYSWLCWAPAALGWSSPLATALVFVGIWGPAAAGLTVVGLSGRSGRRWVRGLLRWRVSARWYAFALGVPVAVVAVVSVAFMLAGQDLEPSLLGERLPSYLPMLAFLVLAGGGNEEWGWRGFALPALLSAHSAVRATLILGSLWALWHVPLLAAQDDLSHGLAGPELALVLAATAATIVAHSFFYTYLFQHTRSALLCALLHGSFNAANGVLVLRADISGEAYAVMQYCITVTLWAAALGLVAVTRGRLGPERPVAPSPDGPSATGSAHPPVTVPVHREAADQDAYPTGGRRGRTRVRR
jgi:uncharacterized protein